MPHSYWSATYRILLLTGLMLITGCNPQPPARYQQISQSIQAISDNSPILPSEQHQGSADDLLQQAQQAPDQPLRITLTLQAIDQLLQARHLQKAQHLLNRLYIPPSMAALTQQKRLSQATLYLLEGQSATASAVLRDIEPTVNAPTEQLIRWHLLTAQAYEAEGHTLLSVRERVQLEPLLTSPAQTEANRIKLWNSLQKLSPETINNLLQQPLSNPIRAWLTLSLISQDPSLTPKQLISKLQQWQQRYPEHPANSVLPSRWKDINIAYAQKPQRLGILLPLHGPQAERGKAIRDGILAAYYYAKKQHRATPNLQFFDSADSSDIQQLYDNAVNNGADVVIGPLSQNAVQQLADNNHLTVPTLALSDLPDTRHNLKKLYQFGLSTDMEATQVALRAHESGYQRAIIISPDTPWGQQMANTLATSWKHFGGEVAGTLNYPDNLSNIAPGIRHVLAIDESDKRANQLKQTLGEPTRFIPTRRQDVDVVLLTGTPQHARQIRPLLRYYFAGNLPVFANSSIYKGQVSAKRDEDLNGIQFCDIPWVLAPSHTLSPDMVKIRQNTAASWPDAFVQHPRLFALGVDAYHLVDHLNGFTLFSRYSLEGATGKLYMSNDHRVYRQLQWARFKHGKPTLIR